MLHKSQTQHGNILLYILGAIFLLGLLVIMVKGSVSPGASIDRETLELRVNEVQAYGNELERAVAYVLRNGYSESDIRFAHPNASSAYGDITDIPERQVFDEFGGGATYRAPPADIQVVETDWIFTAENIVNGVASEGGCADLRCNEIIALLMNVTKSFCLLVNEKNSIPNIGNNPPQDSASIKYNLPYTGTINTSYWIDDIPDRYLFNKQEGCFEGDVDPLAGTYHYYRVLLAR